MGFGGPDPDPAQCEYYAAFAAHLGRVQFDAIYWVLFCFVVCLLFASSWHFAL